jgi:hypothetical protein
MVQKSKITYLEQASYFFGLVVITAVPALAQGQGGSLPATGPFGTIVDPINGSTLTGPARLVVLMRNVLRLIFLVAGIYAFIRIVLAGLKFISSSGDPKGIQAAWEAIWQSLLGLVIIVSSFVIAALAGQLLFGRWDAILNPTIYGPGV